jgi:hypothetical protein
MRIELFSSSSQAIPRRRLKAAPRKRLRGSDGPIVYTPHVPRREEIHWHSGTQATLHCSKVVPNKKSYTRGQLYSRTDWTRGTGRKLFVWLDRGHEASEVALAQYHPTNKNTLTVAAIPHLADPGISLVDKLAALLHTFQHFSGGGKFQATKQQNLLPSNILYTTWNAR